MANEENKEKPKEKKKIEGVSVQDLESYAKKYSTEVFLIIAIVLAMIFSIFDWSFTGANWGVFLAGVGALCGLLAPEQVNSFIEKALGFTTKKDKTTQIMVGVIRILVAIIVPAVIFGIFGLVAGTTLAIRSKKS
jgi:hypothetical protein